MRIQSFKLSGLVAKTLVAKTRQFWRFWASYKYSVFTKVNLRLPSKPVTPPPNRLWTCDYTWAYVITILFKTRQMISAKRSILYYLKNRLVCYFKIITLGYFDHILWAATSLSVELSSNIKVTDIEKDSSSLRILLQ